MQYLLMCCFDETRWNSIPETQREQVMRDYDQWVRDHVASGQYLDGGKLDSSHAATTVREHGGKPLLTDGPFAEAREQIGGFHLLECESREAAIAIAQRIPTLPVGGTVEVRPMLWRLGE